MASTANADAPPTTPAPTTTVTRRLGHSFGKTDRFELSVEGGIGAYRDGPLRDASRLAGFGRIRAGLLRIFESRFDPDASPIFVSVGATYEASNLSPATLGLQTELVHVSSGLWGQFGGLVDVTRLEPGWMGALGWNVFGAEVQRRRYAHDDGVVQSDWALFGKLHIPVTLLIDAL